MARELLAYRLNTLHNLYYYMQLMKKMQTAIASDRFMTFRRDFYEKRETVPCDEDRDVPAG